jgi:serine/threonine protein kinase
MTFKILSYFSASGIIHRDLKPENIMFKAGVAKICDFGFAKTILQFNAASPMNTGDQQQPVVHHTKDVGTPHFMSPGANVINLSFCNLRKI